MAKKKPNVKKKSNVKKKAEKIESVKRIVDGKEIIVKYYTKDICMQCGEEKMCCGETSQCKECDDNADIVADMYKEEEVNLSDDNDYTDEELVEMEEAIDKVKEQVDKEEYRFVYSFVVKLNDIKRMLDVLASKGYDPISRSSKVELIQDCILRIDDVNNKLWSVVMNMKGNLICQAKIGIEGIKIDKVKVEKVEEIEELVDIEEELDDENEENEFDIEEYEEDKKPKVIEELDDDIKEIRKYEIPIEIKELRKWLNSFSNVEKIQISYDNGVVGLKDIETDKISIETSVLFATKIKDTITADLIQQMHFDNNIKLLKKIKNWNNSVYKLKNGNVLLFFKGIELDNKIKINANHLKKIIDDGERIGFRMFPFNFTKDYLKITIQSETEAKIDKITRVIHLDDYNIKKEFSCTFANRLTNAVNNLTGILECFASNNSPILILNNNNNISIAYIVTNF